jgi:hypothetical protein
MGPIPKGKPEFGKSVAKSVAPVIGGEKLVKSVLADALPTGTRMSALVDDTIKPTAPRTATIPLWARRIIVLLRRQP